MREAVKERTPAQQVSVFIDVAGRAAALDDQSAAAFLCTSAAECATWPYQRDPDMTRSLPPGVLDAGSARRRERGELSDTELGPLVELLAAMLCGVWVYVAFLGTEHGRAITPTIHQLLTGRLST